MSRNKTVIYDGSGDKEKIQERRDHIYNELQKLKASENVDEELKKHLTERFKLFDGMAIIYVGGKTKAEMKERYDRFDDAVHATKAAIQEGILPGGGVALFKAASILESLVGKNEDVNAGIKVVQKALAAPLIQIAQNAGKTGVENNIDLEDYNEGYDAQNDRYGDMISFGIIDPTKVVRLALEDAASIAGLMLTTETLISTIDQGPSNMPQNVILR
jgi:chaperonin GroEL